MSDGFDELGADHIGATVEQFNAAMSAYWKKHPNATDADVARFKASWGPLESSSSRAPLYAASGYTAARGGRAEGMTLWHYLFFAVLLAAIFFAPRVFAFAKKHAAPLLRDGLHTVGVFGRRLRKSVT